MKKTFLIGRFLQSHAGAYRHTPPIAGEGTHLSGDVLQKRFRERAIRYRMERHRYVFHFQTGLAAAVLLVIGAFHLDLKPRASAPVNVVSQEIVSLQDIIQTRQELKPPPPPRPPVPVEVPDDVMLEDDDLPLGDLLELTSLTPVPPPPPEKEEAEEAEEEDYIFVVVEKMPEIVGGQAALFATLKYPLIAQRAGIEGHVVVQVVIEEDGSPAMPEVVRSAHEILDEEAVRAVMQQQFTPGQQRGRAVRVRMAIPVNFKLQNS